MFTFLVVAGFRSPVRDPRGVAPVPSWDADLVRGRPSSNSIADFPQLLRNAFHLIALNLQRFVFQRAAGTTVIFERRQQFGQIRVGLLQSLDGRHDFSLAAFLLPHDSLLLSRWPSLRRRRTALAVCFQFPAAIASRWHVELCTFK